MKLPSVSNSKNPRRHFHLSAVQYLLNQCQPQIVWNLCPGNIRTLLPALENWIRNTPSTRPLLWINIDLLPELQSFNTQVLEQHWGVQKTTWGKISHIIPYQQLKIINFQGTFETFPQLFQSIQLDQLSSQQIFICVDGFSNAVKSPHSFFSWWKEFQTFLASFFQGWYFTWLNALTLDTKFAFYYQVTVQKHRQPIQWVEATGLESTDILERKGVANFRINSQTIVLPLITTTFQKIQHQSPANTMGWIFRFFKDPNLQELVYQATYLDPAMFKELNTLETNFPSQQIQYSDYESIDALLFPNENNDRSPKFNVGFVKSLPNLAFKESRL